MASLVETLTYPRSQTLVRLPLLIGLGAALALPAMWVQIGANTSEAKQVVLLTTVTACLLLSVFYAEIRWHLPTLFKVGAIAAAAALSVPFALSPSVSALGTGEHAIGLVVLVALVLLCALAESVAVLSSQLFMLVLAVSACVAGVLTSLYALIQMVGLDPIEYVGADTRPSATFGNPDFMASFLIMSIPLSFFALRKLPKPVLAACVGIQALALIASGGRAATAALLVTGLVVVASKTWRVIFAVLLLSGVVGLARASFHGEDRIAIWSDLLHSIPSHAIVGYGLDSIPRLLWSQSVKTDSSGYIDDGYNAEFDILAETGVIGLLSYVPVVVAVGMGAVAAYRNPRLRFVAITFGAALLAHVIDAQLSISSITAQAASWMLAGTILGVTEGARRGIL